MPKEPFFTDNADESDFPNDQERAIEDAAIAADPQKFVQNCMRGQSAHTDNSSPSKEEAVLPPSSTWTR
jgi:hypothetical protein